MNVGLEVVEQMFGSVDTIKFAKKQSADVFIGVVNDECSIVKFGGYIQVKLDNLNVRLT